MRVPIRKPGTYTHLKPDPHLTAEKYEELRRKLEHLIQISRPRTIEEVKRLASDGDFSENAAYQIAKGRLRGINQRILEIEDHLKRAIIIQPGGSGQVRLGSIVTVEVRGKTRIYHILGSSETDPERGVISHNSPIGQELLGRKEGERLSILVNGQHIEYLVVRID